MTATKANRNTIREEASLSRLSPSMILTSDLGTFICRIMLVAETASGGDIIPPKRKPSAKVNPGITQLDTNAITQEVRMTIGKAKLAITRRQRQNSFQDTCHAA